MYRTTLTTALTTLALAAASGAGVGYSIDWYTIDCGGATFSTSGAISLGGTIGQHDAGQLNTSANFSQVGGFWTIPAPCVGDINNDLMVNFDDLNILLEVWGETGPPGILGDINESGRVDFGDLNLLLDNWGLDCTF